jgi:hypothetical protein
VLTLALEATATSTVANTITFCSHFRNRNRNFHNRSRSSVRPVRITTKFDDPSAVSIDLFAGNEQEVLVLNNSNNSSKKYSRRRQYSNNRDNRPDTSAASAIARNCHGLEQSKVALLPLNGTTSWTILSKSLPPVS